MVDIDAVNTEIQRLNSVRQQYFEDRLKDTKKKFLELEWLKGASFSFVESSGPYGHREYVLRGFVPDEFRDLFNSSRTINLIGNSKNYMDNITARRPYDTESLNSLELYTCSSEAFIDLLRKGVKVSLPFDFKNKFAVYKALYEQFI